jgi:hypothetical protein
MYVQVSDTRLLQQERIQRSHQHWLHTYQHRPLSLLFHFRVELDWRMELSSIE